MESLLVGCSRALLFDQIVERLLIGDGEDYVAHRAYFGIQILFAAVLFVRHLFHDRTTLAPGLADQVKRGAVSMTLFNGWFAGITGFNIGVGAIVMPLLPLGISRFAWLLVLLVTAAWFYVIYWTGSFRNWYLGVQEKASKDR
jgi:hypothetical protein